MKKRPEPFSVHHLIEKASDARKELERRVEWFWQAVDGVMAQSDTRKPGQIKLVTKDGEHVVIRRGINDFEVASKHPDLLKTATAEFVAAKERGIRLKENDGVHLNETNREGE